jgi:hypothetical protein
MIFGETGNLPCGSVSKIKLPEIGMGVKPRVFDAVSCWILWQGKHRIAPVRDD